MADDDGVIRWFAPDPRAIIPLNGFVVSRSLRAVVRRGTYEIAVNRGFEAVMDACAERDEGTWISKEIKQAYTALHKIGFAHSVESWHGGELAGGLYGVSIGGAFFGESMFHRSTDASKAALVFLVERLRERGFALLDIQFLTQHLSQFGAVEISRSEYERRLQHALRLDCGFVD
jgi:leucyl/phenylalanyl-tRNA--protein transferase